MTIAEIAAELSRAKKTHTPIQKISERVSGFSVKEGYQVQELLLDEALLSGAALVGYKMGLTSRAKQRDVGVSQAIRGFLLKSDELSHGASIDCSTRIHPRVEPEIAVVVSKPLKGTSVTLHDVIASLEWLGPAFEIIDSRFEGFSFSLPDVIADNCSGSGFVLGDINYREQMSDVPLFGVTVRKNGKIEHTGAPAAVLGNPIVAVVELVHGLAAEDRGLLPGMVVLTGGITASVTVNPGDIVEFEWPGTTLSVKASKEA